MVWHLSTTCTSLNRIRRRVEWKKLYDRFEIGTVERIDETWRLLIQHLFLFRLNLINVFLYPLSALSRSLRSVSSNRTLSFNPNRNSGIPDRKQFILMQPSISQRTTCPLALAKRLTHSMTSRKTSFFLYLMPSDRQETAFVTAAGIRGVTGVSRLPSWVMYLQWKVFQIVSLNWIKFATKNVLK